MSNKVVSERVRLSAIFISFTILLVGGLSLFENMTIDYYSVVGTLEKIIPASVVMGGLGWVMGMVLDKPKNRGQKMGSLYFNNSINNSEDNSEDKSEESKTEE